MSKIEIKRWNVDGFRSVRTDPAVVAMVQDATATVARQAGRGYKYVVTTDGNRARGRVWPDGFLARRRDRKHNTLAKLAASRGMKVM